MVAKTYMHLDIGGLAWHVWIGTRVAAGLQRCSCQPAGAVMRELVRTTDVVLVSAVEALLSEAGIPSQVFDRDIRAIEGSINAFPMRVVVSTTGTKRH